MTQYIVVRKNDPNIMLSYNEEVENPAVFGYCEDKEIPQECHTWFMSLEDFRSFYHGDRLCNHMTGEILIMPKEVVPRSIVGNVIVIWE